MKDLPKVLHSSHLRVGGSNTYSPRDGWSALTSRLPRLICNLVAVLDVFSTIKSGYPCTARTIFYSKFVEENCNIKRAIRAYCS